jgi:hypothetical protein
MSSGKFRAHRGWNPTQIKNGRIVRLRKDGSIKSDLGPAPTAIKKPSYQKY